MRSRLARAGGAPTIVLGVLAVVAVVAAVLVVGTPSSSSAADRVVTVERGVVQSTVSGSGNLAPIRQLDLNFGTSGTVTRIYVKEGQRVHEGELLARVDPSSAEVDLATAKANLSDAQDALDSVAGTTSTSSYSGGDDSSVVDAVYRGDAHTAYVADVTTTTTPPTTTRTTTPTPTTPTTTPTPAGTGAATSGGAASGLSGGGSSASGGGSSGSTTSEATAEANVASAKLKVKEAQDALDDTELRAPMAGTVASVNGEVGDTVTAGSTTSSASSTDSSSSSSSGSGSAGTPSGGSGATGSASSGSSSSSSSDSSGFITLVNVHRFTMDVSLSESDIDEVKKGQAATVTVNAADGAQFAARVTSIAVLASSSSGDSAVSYPVELTLQQSSGKLKDGMSASADIVVGQASEIVVPTAALTGSTVTLVKGDGDVTQRVTTGVQGDGSTQIVSGLKAGDKVKERSVSAAAGAAAAGGGGTSSGLSGATRGRSGGLALPGGGGFPGGGPPGGG